MGKQTYQEIVYKAPFKGLNVDMPENVIDSSYSPNLLNFILKNGEIRTRPRIYQAISGPPDNYQMNVITSFLDGNGVVHTVTETKTGLWQLNPSFRNTKKPAWNLVGQYPTQPGPGLPVSHVTFLNKFYWTNGGNNLWVWDGITSIGFTSPWPASSAILKNNRIVDSNGNVQIATQAGTTGAAAPAWAVGIGNTTTDNTVLWVNNGKPAPANGFISTAVVDAANGITAGGYFLGELNSRLLLLNTLEGKNGSYQNFSQRVRWSPSGITSIWDPNVNLGAGYSDELDVPDSITGFLTIGRTGFIFRVNGITELVTSSLGLLPFDFNHLWASDRGIGNVYSFSIAGYGPVGMFISNEEIYELSIGGFKKVAGVALNAIFNDLAAATSNPVANILPYYSQNYIYPFYMLCIPIGADTKVWTYSLKEESWQPYFLRNAILTGRTRFASTS